MKPKRRKFWPYFILTILCFYTFTWFASLYDTVPGEYPMNLIYVFDEVENYWLEKGLIFSFTPKQLLIGAIGAVIPLLMYLRPQDRGVYRHLEEEGSASFASPYELKRFQDKKFENNIILSQNAKMSLFNKNLPRNFQKNKNIVVLGGPGTGKTYNFVKPNLMQLHGSYIVTDPKGLLIHETGKMFKEAGYQIKVFDLVNMLNSDKFNVFDYIKTELDIDRVLEAITVSTQKSENQGEDFWVQAEALLMRSLVAYLWFDGQIHNYTPNLAMLSELINGVQRIDKKEPSMVEKMMLDLNKERPDNYAWRQWQGFNNNFEDKTRASVLAVAIARYSVFQHDQVVKMVEEDTLDIESWNEKKTVCFIAIPETNKAYNFIVSLMFSTIMEVLRHKADQVLTGKLKLKDPLLHVRFIIDEFANIGKIPNLDMALATFRSREMSITIILQALAQLKSMYEKSWETLLNTCDTLLFLGGNEENTTKYLSMRAGKQTLAIKNNSRSYGRNGSTSISQQTKARDLMTPDEVAHLQGGDALVFISGQYVLKDKVFTVDNHKNAKMISNSPEDNNWYDYYISSETEEARKSADEAIAWNNDDEPSIVIHESNDTIPDYKFEVA